MKRKLVSIRTISDITPINGADMIECAHVDGWTCVVKKGEFNPGDKCIYFEIDSFLPESDSRFAFLMKQKRTFEGVEGHRVRTITLRGQLSQGVVLPLDAFPEVRHDDDGDLSENLNIKKWEAPIPAELSGQLKGGFPSFIRKTDEERAQNLLSEIFEDNKDSTYEVSIKLDGTSMTCYKYDDECGVCSRNYELKVNEENKNNTFVKIASNGLLDALKSAGKNVAVQGEVMGEGVQKNREKIKGHKLFVFNIFDIDAQKYLNPDDRTAFFEKHLSEVENVEHVPVIGVMKLPCDNIEDLLAFADGESIANPIREGLVWKRIDGGFSFKTISNKYLMKSGS